MKVAILGAGAWGTALAIALSRRHRVALCARDAAQAQAMLATRVNARYLPEVALPEPVLVTADVTAALDGASLALLATPVAGLREAVTSVRERRAGGSALPILWACKGFERGSARLPHQVVDEVAGADAPSGALSGPSFALEVARGQPTALTLASRDAAFARDTARELNDAALRVYFSTDLVGVETGGAVKNVLAIATGICDGLELGLNARAALITRGLAEIRRLGVALGAQPDTFTGLTGMGDLILTCTGDLSRNRRVGLLLAGGLPLSQALAQLGHVAEGVNTAHEVLRLAQASSVDMPVTQAVCAVLDGRLAPAAAVRELMSRDPRGEA
jgi:glycerol-3-phosphate dehydrogenase (NAD(P)+)